VPDLPAGAESGIEGSQKPKAGSDK
jgi:hypothetical protein